jgi:putative Mg2+ transporter-C (MgtC) family protein
MPSFEVLLLRLVVVIIIGGLIGVERELKSKSAGFRTIMLICVGSFLFTTFSYYISPQTPDRIASNIVTGIGFLGAGVIFKGENKVNGLTTAATIWVTAALGMGVATGMYMFVFIATGMVLASLFILIKLEFWMDKISKYKTYKITFPYRKNIMEDYETLMKKYHLIPKRTGQEKNGSDVIIFWTLKGKETDHQKFVEYLMQDSYVEKFEI